MAVKKLDGGWYGATGDGQDIKRMFRTQEEAEAADSLFVVANQKPKEKPEKK